MSSHLPYLSKYLINFLRKLSTNRIFQETEISKIRNIGILAHIDAGKTTTTERMLFYSGLISQMGEVHHGNTVTDYMTQERERGITITSAAVTFYWRTHQFNLIDTPGHIDFTMEVEQSLNVLDGAVFLLDASAGVEAQTLTVWRQADRYNIPRLIFLNKMDRSDASVKLCLESIQNKLNAVPLCLQLPVKENDKLTGLIDILTMEKLAFTNTKCDKTQLTESSYPKLWEEAIDQRSKLIDKLSDYDETLAEKIISEDSIDKIKTIDVVDALKRSSNKQEIVPVIMGSAYKNIGVQPLMDAAILYLPSPELRNKNYKYYEDNLCAKAFKIIHSKQRGLLVFTRVYNGTINKGQKIYSVTQDKNENVGRVYTAFADDLHEVDVVKSGNIGVLSGLKHTKMGDLLSNSASAAQRAKDKLSKSSADSKELFDLNVKIPEPVFFCSIEPESASYQTALDNALSELQREDPSFTVTQNTETGQTELGGMGELHLEIIKDRIIRDYKVKADLGPLQINYQEALVAKTKDTLEFASKISGSEQKFTITLSVIPNEGEFKETFLLDKTTEAAKNIAAIYNKHLVAIKNGVDFGLGHGPRLGCKVSNVQVMLHHFTVNKGTSETVISAGTTKLIQKMINEVGTDILEPIMKVEIVSPENHVSVILADLTRRRAIIEEISIRKNTKVITSQIPLAELLGYSTVLRTVSSGTATFTMEFHAFKRMSALEEEKAIKRVRGF